MNKNSIVRLERGGDSRYSTVLGIENALKQAGVVFREDGSVFHPNCLIQPVKLKQAA